MRKCLPIVVYRSSNYALYELSAILLNGERITLCTYDEISVKYPYKYKSFTDFQKDIITWLRHNGLKVSKTTDFGADFYNIVWVDVENPTCTTYRYGVKAGAIK